MTASRSVSKSWMALGALLLPGSGATGADSRVGQFAPRVGDEIVACGRFVHTTTRVVLWMDPGGYDAYRVERRFGPPEPKGTNGRDHVGFGTRRVALTTEQAERVRGGGWDLPLLRQFVDQFVIHFDARGTSRGCFEVLHDRRGLGVHFLLDLDGTVYQTLDLKEGAWHATVANGRSVGIEVANAGAFPVGRPDPFARFYQADASGKVRLILPEGEGIGARLGADWVARPARDAVVVGEVQGQRLRQYDYTPEQYDALIKLTATLCKLFPRIPCDYPRGASGRLVLEKLPDPTLRAYQGLLGHYHVQTDKVDPGPAFEWDKVVNGARSLLGEPTRKAEAGKADAP